jgi:WD40 repeat protein
MTAIAISGDGQNPAVSYTDKTIRVYPLPDGSLMKTIDLPSSSGRQITLIFSPDGQNMAVGLASPAVFLFLSIVTGKMHNHGSFHPCCPCSKTTCLF